MSQNLLPPYVVYAGRFRVDPCSALVIDVAATRDDAIRIAKTHGDAIVVETESGETLYDTKIIELKENQ